MSKPKPISIILHLPSAEEDNLMLLRQTAEMHAEYVLETIHNLSIPSEQKLELVNAVIAAAKSAK